MKPVIEIQSLTKDYEVGFWRKRRIRALDDLSLEVKQGEIFGFLGANGAGKTTTLKLLMRLIFPTSGTARILGHDIADVSTHQHIGYLPENPYFYDYLTARELLDYFGQIFGLTRIERSNRAEQLLARVRLEQNKWDVQLRKFSKGMLQRVGLAQALINEPDVVFLDEPMSGLDPIGRREVRDLIASLRHEGKTVFMCSHILSDIEVLCDRVAILKRGRLAHIGYLEQIRQNASNHGYVEIVATGTDVSTLERNIGNHGGSRITATASGLKVEVADEKSVDAIIAALRKSGGQLVSVQPLRQSLEELFLEESSETVEKK